MWYVPIRAIATCVHIVESTYDHRANTHGRTNAPGSL
jgi:hypothetical protein